MANNPKAKDNLRILKKGETANPNGRPKKIINLIAETSKEEQLKIYSRLWNILQCSSIQEAKEMAGAMQSEDFGIIFQLAFDALSGPNGWRALMDIFDRLFGKPKIITDNVVEQKEPGLLIRFDDSGKGNQE